MILVIGGMGFIGLNTTLRFLEVGQRVVRRVGAGMGHAVEALEVPAPRAHRIALEVVAGAELGDVPGPHRIGVAAAEGGDPGGQADPGAGDHQQAAAQGRQGGGELGGRVVRRPRGFGGHFRVS